MKKISAANTEMRLKRNKNQPNASIFLSEINERDLTSVTKILAKSGILKAIRK